MNDTVCPEIELEEIFRAIRTGDYFKIETELKKMTTNKETFDSLDLLTQNLVKACEHQPIHSLINRTETEKLKEVKKALFLQITPKNYPRTFTILQILTQNYGIGKEIKELYAKADKYCKKERLNSHDFYHALVTAYFSLNLFRILWNQAKDKLSLVQSYEKIFSKDDSLMVIITGAILHDIGRSAKENHALQSKIESKRLLEQYLPEIFKNMGLNPEQSSIIKTRICEIVENHENLSTSLSFEEGIVKVADALHCDKGRVFKDDLPFQLRLIEDQLPQDYYSCKCISKVLISKGSKTKPVRVTFYTEGDLWIVQWNNFKKKMFASKLKSFFEIYQQPHNASRKRIWI